jgi:pyruvate,orthophosphate dikinase
MKELDTLRKITARLRRGESFSNEILNEMSVDTFANFLNPSVNHSGKVLGRGLGASPGVVSGRLCFSAKSVSEVTGHGESAVLMKMLTTPSDLDAMLSCDAVVMLSGSRSSHAAVVTRGIGKPCVVSLSGRLEEGSGLFWPEYGPPIPEKTSVVVDGNRGILIQWLDDDAISIAATSNLENIEAIRDFLDECRKIGDIEVRVNADSAESAALGLQLGVMGVGLCRTEHFFLGENSDILKNALLQPRGSKGYIWRSEFVALQRDAFAKLLETCQGKPCTIRLLDPPTSEFLPSDNSERFVNARHRETNPMLGLRGARLGVIQSELYELQTRALAQAVASLSDRVANCKPQILIPMVSTGEEFNEIRSRVESAYEDIARINNIDPDIEIGAMIETPRAALCSADIAKNADFLSIGTNDLMQLTWGIDRDEAPRKFLDSYMRSGLLKENPLTTLESSSVLRLIDEAITRARIFKPGMSVGVCGEHVIDPLSLARLIEVGASYVSCSSVDAARVTFLAASISGTFGNIRSDE